MVKGEDLYLRTKQTLVEQVTPSRVLTLVFKSLEKYALTNTQLRDLLVPAHLNKG